MDGLSQRHPQRTPTGGRELADRGFAPPRVSVIVLASAGAARACGIGPAGNGLAGGTCPPRDGGFPGLELVVVRAAGDREAEDPWPGVDLPRRWIDLASPAGGGGPEAAWHAVLAAVGGELVTVWRPGDRWPAGRIDRDAAALVRDAEAAASAHRRAGDGAPLGAPTVRRDALAARLSGWDRRRDRPGSAPAGSPPGERLWNPESWAPVAWHEWLPGELGEEEAVPFPRPRA